MDKLYQSGALPYKVGRCCVTRAGATMRPPTARAVSPTIAKAHSGIATGVVNDDTPASHPMTPGPAKIPIQPKPTTCDSARPGFREDEEFVTQYGVQTPNSNVVLMVTIELPPNGRWNGSMKAASSNGRSPVALGLPLLSGKEYLCSTTEVLTVVVEHT